MINTSLNLSTCGWIRHRLLRRNSHLICIVSIVVAVVFSPSEPYSRSSFSSNEIHIQIWITVYGCNVNNLSNTYRGLHDLAIWGHCRNALHHVLITNEGFVYWCNFKTPPHPEYTVDILALGVYGGLFCFYWEVKMNKILFWKHL
jgi:hypothetical protein